MATVGLCLLVGPWALLGCATDEGGGEGNGFFDEAFDFPPSPTQAVAMATDTTDPDNRREGLLWLSSAKFGGEEVYLELYRLFHNDQHPNVRAAAAKALGMHGKSEDAAYLMLLLEDDDPFTRWQAANGLRMIHNPAAAEPLTARLDPSVEEAANVRQAAADALGQYPTIAVFNSLLVALEDRDYAVVDAARRSLIALTGHDAGVDPRDWSAWSSANAGDLFANQQVYTYQPYVRPRYWSDYVTFWDEFRRDDGPKTPAGM